jgi:transposase
MGRELVPDELWDRIEPLLPVPLEPTKMGRPRCSDRACLRGIVFVLRTGIAWRDLPAEVFGCSGVTCWRRLQEWTRAGVFRRLQRDLLDELGILQRIDWTRASIDSGSVRALRRGPAPARTRQTAANRARSTILSWTGRADL